MFCYFAPNTCFQFSKFTYGIYTLIYLGRDFKYLYCISFGKFQTKNRREFIYNGTDTCMYTYITWYPSSLPMQTYKTYAVAEFPLNKPLKKKEFRKARLLFI